ncbi:MAG: hypothetical protein RQ966_02170 [Acetobacteraceae bacterium]|nr:hypothetical protein [Acetobacteraceae bacterium]
MSYIESAPDSGALTHRPAGLTVLIGGGFKFETACLLPKLADSLDLHCFCTEWGGTPGTDGIPVGQYESVPSFATVTRPGYWRSTRAFIVTFWRSLQRIRRHRIDLVFGFGCSHMVPMLLAARLLRRQTIFIESITRADTLSTTGRIVYRLRLADTFIVQWPELKRDWPRAELGTIL